jgi:hypothetical protein
MKHGEVPQILSRSSKTYIVHRESPTFKIKKGEEPKILRQFELLRFVKYENQETEVH